MVDLAVPAGSYVVLAKTQLSHTGAGDTIDCMLKAGTANIDQVSMKTLPALAAIPVSLQAVTVTASVPAECRVRCADGQRVGQLQQPNSHTDRQNSVIAAHRFRHGRVDDCDRDPVLGAGRIRVPMNSRTAVASSCARRASRAAISEPSSLDKNASSGQCLVDHRPRNLAPLFCVPGADDDDIERDFETAKLAT